MLIFNLIANPAQFIGFIIALVLALSFHEAAHAYVANALGDPTAKLHGRLTLNPIAHLDFLGTIFLLLAGFGWGKPVPVNPQNFRSPRLDNLTVALSGPMSNFLLATVFGLIFRFLSPPAPLDAVIALIIFFNLVLMIFNLIPIPPLDGSKILSLFLSDEMYLNLQRVGIGLLFALIIFSSFFYPVIPTLMFRGVSFFFTLITGKPVSI